jgi:hypothetical protein
MKIIQYLVFVAIGVLFMVSGILKLYPIEMLELDLGYHTGMPEWLSMIAARLLIGFELVLGFLLMIRFQERRTLKWAGAVLVFFSFYLIYLMIQFPGQDNCGCMGMIAPMSPLQSLLKNLGMLGLIVFLLVIKSFETPLFLLRLQKGMIVFVVVGFTLPFVLNTIDWSKDDMRQSFQPSIQQNVLTGLMQKEKRTCVLAYLSPHCIYCKMLARKWEWFKSRNQWETPMHVVFMGQNIESDIQEFLYQTGLSVSSYTTMNDVEFIQKTHGSLPSIYVVQNEFVVQKDNFISFNEQNLRGQLSR